MPAALPRKLTLVEFGEDLVGELDVELFREDLEQVDYDEAELFLQVESDCGFA